MARGDGSSGGIPPKRGVARARDCTSDREKKRLRFALKALLSVRCRTTLEQEKARYQYLAALDVCPDLAGNVCSLYETSEMEAARRFASVGRSLFGSPCTRMPAAVLEVGQGGGPLHKKEVDLLEHAYAQHVARSGVAHSTRYANFTDDNGLYGTKNGSIRSSMPRLVRWPQREPSQIID